MGAIDGILREEVKRLMSAQKSYGREIRKLPKGSIQIKYIKKIAYPYLASRYGKKVISKYLGHYSERRLKKLKQAILQRKKYEQHLKEVNRNIKRILQMTHGKRRKTV